MLCKLSLIEVTTGLKQKRLERTGLHNHFDVVVISEEVGAAKPHPDVFDHALERERMGHPNRKHVLMVGDAPGSDILGGINAGLDTCWLNAQGVFAPEGIVPTYEVSCLKEFQELLLK